MKKNVSLKDIAEHVGVSTALVSYVLNNKLKDRINKDVAAKIRQAAEDLNYRPNQIARSLKAQKTFTIGLIVADISNPFSSQIARIIEDEAKNYGYSVIFGSSDESIEKTSDLIKLFLDRQVDELIIALPEQTESQVQHLKKINVPFVLIDRYYPDIKTNSVSINNFSAAQKAIQHLLDNGRKRIGVVAYKTSLFHLNERIRGAVDLLADNALVGEVKINSINEDVIAAIDWFLADPNPVDAIFFTSNLLAVSGLKYINKIGIRIPEQLAVVGFDETDAFDLFYAPISYVKQPLNELGSESIKLLLKTIDDKENNESIELETELVIRNSSINQK
ncbi:transcriptional regulator, LacI family [Paludibacter propionicigenes WB4]|uniref:Transcriptional regulator, LacI family n=1 Tax=Paludibacter propionicigenes (strain DSM 17365 / JCM 13257 / WB4) TaxID=694427 RepID=E4T080_PALPW|nr:substrate-binding domain-containing protein [Paludibacter propionicigenes]ADQ78270.1 transcriptional regulator, LacI family [Paludibacter propionicigenes WB4]